MSYYAELRRSATKAILIQIYNISKEITLKKFTVSDIGGKLTLRIQKAHRGWLSPDKESVKCVIHRHRFTIITVYEHYKQRNSAAVIVSKTL